MNIYDNIFSQKTTISQSDRQKLNGHKGLVIWITGLSGAGKSTLANALEIKLYEQNKHTYILDGDNVRLGLNKDLGFSDNERKENIRRITETAKLMLDAGLIVITAFISPFRSERLMAKEIIGADNFIEIFINTSLAVCEKRDAKGLYKKARLGLLSDMTGIQSPYEEPTNADFIIDGTEHISDETIDSILNQIINKNNLNINH